MDTVLFEIVELANGDIALQRADDEGEPLVTIHFSEESTFHLQDTKVDVARAMVQAGLELVSELSESASDDDSEQDDARVDSDSGSVQIH